MLPKPGMRSRGVDCSLSLEKRKRRGSSGEEGGGTRGDRERRGRRGAERGAGVRRRIGASASGREDGRGHRGEGEARTTHSLAGPGVLQLHICQVPAPWFPLGRWRGKAR